MRQCPQCSTMFDDAVEVCSADGAKLGEADPMLGRVLDGKYRIDALLGRGGMGAVYRARHLTLERDVAIKLIRGDFATDERKIERFKREALAVARLKHPHIVDVYDYSASPGADAYLVLEYVAGRPLATEIQQRGVIPPGAATDLMRQVCSAVQAAHDAGVVHRDLKPDNILLEISAGGAVMTKVLDFGIAKIARLDEIETGADSGAEPAASLTVDGALMGTPRYMSPEQCLGEKADERSDVYSLGCVLYEMVTGRPPFVAASSHVLIMKHVMEVPKPASTIAEGLPEAVDAVLARALAKGPGDRYQTAADLGRALAEVRSGLEPSTAFPPVLVPGGAHFGTGSATLIDVAVTRPQAPNNLPHETTSFVGRERDLDEVDRLLTESRLVTLLGPGGIGKTRLSLQTASRAISRFEHGVWLVELSALADPALVPKAVATAAGIREEHGQTVVEAIEARFAHERVFLVLDNCEHLVVACAELVDRLLRTCPGLQALASSQAPLGLPSEIHYRVPPLSVAPGAGAAEAVTLFVQRARQQNPGFRLTAENARAVERVCARLEGIPLAIELAAARVRVLSVEQIDARLDDRLRILTGGSSAAQPRQRTLRGALDWSYGLLADDERTLLARLSVFAGGWTLESAESLVLSAESSDPSSTQHSALSTQHSALSTQHSPWEILDLLTQLVDKSLVGVETGREEVRYRMLETVRQYAAERLAETSTVDATKTAHRDHFLGLAERAEPELTGSGLEGWLDRLEVEHENFRAALAWSAARPDGSESLLRIANALYRFWHIRGHLAEAHSWLTRGLESSASAPSAVRARALYALGAIEVVYGAYERAERLQEEALALQQGADDAAGTAFTLNSLGTIAYYTGDYAKARARYEESVGVFRRLGLQANLANALNNLGMILRSGGDRDAARAAYEEALGLARSLGNRAAIARTLMSLGIFAAEDHLYGRAQPLYEESLALFREIGDRRMTASLLNNMGDVARNLGDVERASELYRDAVDIHTDLGDEPNAVYSLTSFASLAEDLGRHERAMRLAGAFEALRERFGLKLNPHEQDDWDEHVALARDALGAEAADAASAAGARLSVREAVDYAREG